MKEWKGLEDGTLKKKRLVFESCHNRPCAKPNNLNFASAAPTVQNLFCLPPLISCSKAISLKVYLLSMMQTRDSSPPPTVPALKFKRYTCKQCKCCFRNRSGLTQHTHAKHPRFSPPPAPYIPDDEQPVNQDPFSQVPGIGDPWAEVPTREEMDVPMNDSSERSDASSEHLDAGSSTMFVGQDDTLFRNYHPSLTGEQHTDISFTY